MKEQLHNVKTMLLSDPKRTCVLGVLVLVLAVIWGRMMMKSGPTPASAKPVSSSSKGTTPTSQAGRVNYRSTNDLPALQKWLSEPIGLSDRNLFEVRYEHFPRDGSRRKEEAVVGPTGFWDELAKSMTSQADQRQRRQYLVENVQRQAASLKLQSTLMSGQLPRALVNGEQVGEGDVVAVGTGSTRTEFRVLKIEARRIIVEREGVKLEIQMN
jgi:hypothetical protein